MPIKAVRLGRAGVAKQIFLGSRASDDGEDYMRGFVDLARGAA
jgi:LysR family transcriptional regulator for metE and metH